MNDTTERILIEALDLLEQGVGVDEIVARYPAQAAELRPFLLTATALSNLAHQPTLTAQAQSKRAFLETAEQAAVEKSQPRQVAGGWLRRLMAPALAVLLVMFLGGAGLVSASGSAVPGDALYQTKRWVEEVRLNLTTDPEAAAVLREQFRQERVSEIEQLLADGRAAAVSLSGEIEAMDGERWTVAGVPVLVASATVIDGLPAVGALVQVDGLTGDRAVIASRVMVMVAGPAPDPTPTETPAPSPSPTPRPSATIQAADDDDDNENDNDDDAPIVPPPGSQPGAQPTTAPTAAPIVQPTSPPPAPTAVPPPPPTATPDDDDDNDNDDNDDNDNDDTDNDNDGDDAGDDDDGGDDNGGDDADDTGSGSGGDDDTGDDNSDDNDSSGSGGGDDGGGDDESDNDGDSDGDNDDDNDGGDDGDDNDGDD